MILQATGAIVPRDASELRELVLERVEEGFHPDTHVALGPWCFAGVEHVYPDWDALAFAESFQDGRERWVQAEAVRRLAGALLDQIYPEMNRLHRTSYDRAFWHTVLFDWLLHLVMFSWRMWRHVELFISKTGDEALTLRLPAKTARDRICRHPGIRGRLLWRRKLSHLARLRGDPPAGAGALADVRTPGVRIP